MNDSQEIFENLFNLNFMKSLGVWNKSKSSDTVVSDFQSKVILERNALDVELYKYAVKLFNNRLKMIRERKKNMVVIDNTIDDSDDNTLYPNSINSSTLNG